jgi:APA family basic amino acid/polyamine antiporter
MAERRPKGAGLERVLGTGALFSTAYGNVGSTVYYALGLVAVFALGMTPLVFVVAGVIFVCTAATYTEATTMYPEAGGSASFARRGFNEFWSFFAAWGQMLNYIITIAISAFFLPHYLGVFWEPLRSSPAAPRRERQCPNASVSEQREGEPAQRDDKDERRGGD